MIYPTIGRVVWVVQKWQDQPQAALITYVHNENTVNVVAFDRAGVPAGIQGLHLKQSADEQPPTPYAEWMPYQVGQAKRHEDK